MTIDERFEIFTTGFPRSGSTWLDRLLSDALSSPLQTQPGELIIWHFAAERDGEYVVRKKHWQAHEYPEKGFNGPSKIVFIQRDPRDVAVSALNYNEVPLSDESLVQVIFSMVDNRPWENVHQVHQQPGVYERWLQGWVHGPIRADVMTRYEALHENGIVELSRIVQALTDEAPDATRIEKVYERQRFENWVEEYPHSMWKGKVGHWHNFFKRHHGKQLTLGLGEFMIEQGYVDSLDWWRELPA